MEDVVEEVEVEVASHDGGGVEVASDVNACVGTCVRGEG